MKRFFRWPIRWVALVCLLFFSSGVRVEASHALSPRSGLYRGTIYVDVSDTTALPPGTQTQFEPHEETLREVVAGTMDDHEKSIFQEQAEQGFRSFQQMRRDNSIPIEKRYDLWLRPFVGLLRKEHFEQLVRDWRFNRHFVEGIQMVRTLLGISPDSPVNIEIVSGINRDRHHLFKKDGREEWDVSRVVFI